MNGTLLDSFIQWNYSKWFDWSVWPCEEDRIRGVFYEQGPLCNFLCLINIVTTLLFHLLFRLYYTLNVVCYEHIVNFTLYLCHTLLPITHTLLFYIFVCFLFMWATNDNVWVSVVYTYKLEVHNLNYVVVASLEPLCRSTSLYCVDLSVDWYLYSIHLNGVSHDIINFGSYSPRWYEVSQWAI